MMEIDQIITEGLHKYTVARSAGNNWKGWRQKWDFSNSTGCLIVASTIVDARTPAQSGLHKNLNLKKSYSLYDNLLATHKILIVDLLKTPSVLKTWETL